jgi:malonyl-CoA/methylmalonyl-CoA synthetase
VTSVDPGAGGTLLERWSYHWRHQADTAVLIDGGDPSQVLTGGALDQHTAATAAALQQLGVQPGDRVLWSSQPSLVSVVWLIGALRLGAVVVPVSPSLTSGEIDYVVHDVRPRAAVIERPEQQQSVTSADSRVVVQIIDTAQPTSVDHTLVLNAARPEDDALIVYTSGTTGQPKGAVHTHRSLLAGVESLQLAWAWQSDDRLILTLPLFHVHGLCAGLFGTLASGASAVVFDRFDPTAVFGALPTSTMYFGVPTMYHRLAQTDRLGELAALRLCVSGSAALAPDLWEVFNRRGVSVLERYGMSETLLTLSNPLVGERRPGSVGLPLPRVEAEVGEPDDAGVGDLMVRGPSLFRGYWDRPETSRTDKWFVTGDLASVADDGYFSIRGRRTELIITGGHNVYPAEVEAVLSRHDSVAEVAVIGVPSAEWGESVVAFVVGRDGAPDIAALHLLVTQELAPYKHPREFRVIDALPRNAMGKVTRRALL